MRRRRFVQTVGATAAIAVAGCLGAGDRGSTTEPLDPTQVTTTGGAEIAILIAQVVIREEEDGPRIYYQLRNDGDEGATVEIRTALSIDDGGTYEASAVVDVAAGQEVFVEYPVVRYDELTPVERENVRRGDADFDTYVNGELRTDV